MNKFILSFFVFFFSFNLYAVSFCKDEIVNLDKINTTFFQKGKKNMMCSLRGDC